MSGARVPPASPPARCGLTLPELLVVLVLLAVVIAVTGKVVRGQRRSLAAAVELVEIRSQLRQAIHLLAAELRPLSPDAGDIHEWGTSALRFRSFFGSSAACRRASDSTLVVPSPAGPERLSPSSWLVQPQAGDSLLVYDSGPRFSAADDRWRAYEIAAVTAAGVAERCDSAFASPAAMSDERAPVRIRLSSGVPLPRTVATGAPIRFFRPVRYALYRSSDTRWYLGASDCNAARSPPCATIQPVSGPYGPRQSGDALAGLAIEYHDREGRRLVPGTDASASIARVVLVVRAETPGLLHGGTGGVRDSLFLTVAPRGAFAGGVVVSP